MTECLKENVQLCEEISIGYSGHFVVCGGTYPMPCRSVILSYYAKTQEVKPEAVSYSFLGRLGAMMEPID